ncbi:MAG: VWA domain-containing protein [Methylococcaceae bacterium]|nr:VWA domain-containing protein [Methylococcaceae bacterium]
MKPSLIDLRKKAVISLEKKQLIDIKASVVLVLDVSKSMFPLYKNGTIQQIIERVLALAIQLDEHQQVDAYVFGTNAVQLEKITEADLQDYVEREIVAKHKINQATKYSKAIEQVQQNYFGKYNQPIFVIFITDGDCSDKKETQAWLRQVSRQPIFWQFVGIGKEEFVFLNKLDTLEKRGNDNAGVMLVSDIATIPDNVLYDRLLNEFPQWLEIVKTKGIIKV